MARERNTALPWEDDRASRAASIITTASEDRANDFALGIIFRRFGEVFWRTDKDILYLVLLKESLGSWTE